MGQKTDKDRKIRSINRNNKKLSSTVNELLDNLHFDAFKRVRTSEIDRLDQEFNSIMQSEGNNLTKRMDGDTTNFIAKLFRELDMKDTSTIEDINRELGINTAQIESFLTDAYKNIILKYKDVHELAKSLNELREAILITRDSIASADIVDGHINRSISFGDLADDDENNDTYIPIVEEVEKKFKLKESTKNFIIPKGLEYGTYYGYAIPYSDIFKGFDNYKHTDAGQITTTYESAIFESTDIDDIYSTIHTEFIKDKNEGYTDDTGKDELNDLLNRVSIVQEGIPIPVLEEGLDALSFIKNEKLVNDTFGTFTEKKNDFKNIMGNKIDTGVISTKSPKNNNFNNVKDCYTKLIDPLHMMPVKLLNYTVGYIYIQEEDASALKGSLSTYMYMNKVGGFNDSERTFVDKLAMKIVKSFDKKFLDNNMKFKDLIVNAINYYNLKERRISFQFIPPEYVTEFKVNEDENGNGTSILEPSLFDGKLYLMLLLFKMLSIVNNSNDTQVNYIKTSGLNKNVNNKVQEVARNMQQRQVNILDMFSYTSMVNKINKGNKIFLPVGKGEQRGIESEILSGQDIQINTELMELLRSNYISATGVPTVIMNYINEADYAKTIELANTRYQGRVVSLQLDFNSSITEYYKNILRFSTNIPEDIINNFKYVLNPPKFSNSTTTQDLIGNFNTFFEFITSVLLGDKVTNDTDNYAELIRILRLSVAKEKLPMLNLDKFESLFEDAYLRYKQSLEKPKTDDDTMTEA